MPSTRSNTTLDPLRMLIASLAIPAAAAPMTAVSTPELVSEAIKAGVIGSFPTSNAISLLQLDEWFDQICRATAHDNRAGLLMANLIVGRQNHRLEGDLETIVKHKVPLVVTSVGNPSAVIEPLHEAGILVIADVASMRHVEKALELGVDGLALLSAGAGGHTGWANPLAFVRAVRAISDIPLAVAGGMSDGYALWAAITAGYDLGWFGTRFIATHESGAHEEWRSGLINASLDDVAVTVAPNGVSASTLRSGAGSGGHTVSAVSRIVSTSELVAELIEDWHHARAQTRALLA